MQTGLCVERKGHFALGTQSTFIEQSSPHYLKHLTNWRLKAVAAAEEMNTANFLITAPMSLSEHHYEIFREKLVKLLQDLLAEVRESKEEATACLNIDFFKF